MKVRKRIEFTFTIECENEYQFELRDSLLRNMADAMMMKPTHKKNKMLTEISVYEGNEKIRATIGT